MTYPHLTDSASVRQEASDQYGGLSDAAAFTAAHRATIDPNVEAAARRHRNEDETAKVQDDLSLAQSKLDEAYGEGEFTVLDAAVRGNALSMIVEDASGRPSHKVVGWNDKYKAVAGPTVERISAESEAAKGRLGAEARAEVQRLVQEATAKAVAQITEKLGSKTEEVDKTRDEQLKEATGDDDSDEKRAALNAGLPLVGSGGDSDDDDEKEGAEGVSPGGAQARTRPVTRKQPSQE